VGVRLEWVSDWSGCQIGIGVRFQWVSDWSGCQIEVGVRLEWVSDWNGCQIGVGVRLEWASDRSRFERGYRRVCTQMVLAHLAKIGSALSLSMLVEVTHTVFS